MRLHRAAARACTHCARRKARCTREGGQEFCQACRRLGQKCTFLARFSHRSSGVTGCASTSNHHPVTTTPLADSGDSSDVTLQQMAGHLHSDTDITPSITSNWTPTAKITTARSRLDSCQVRPALHGSSAGPAAADGDNDYGETSNMQADGILIPPLMMPKEHQAMLDLDCYFTFIHPYVPVLDKASFYEQWCSARHGISPLIQVGIFACVARHHGLSTAQGWLDLAQSIETRAKDLPRLDTLKGLIILSKAREHHGLSQRAVEEMVQMAIDLGLHVHHQQHQPGFRCGWKSPDCQVQTHIWQILFCLEFWSGSSGGSSGVHEYTVDEDTVEFDLPASTPSPTQVGNFDHQIRANSTHLARAVREIRRTQVLQREKRQYDMDVDDSDVLGQDQVIANLDAYLPAHIQITFRSDGYPPYLGRDHFTPHIYMHALLNIVLHNWPLCEKLWERKDPRFDKHLGICTEAAIRICCLQEALWRDFGLQGLRFIPGGSNFTHCCVTACMKVYQTIILASPISFHGYQFYKRHCRVLQACLDPPDLLVDLFVGNPQDRCRQDIDEASGLKPTAETRGLAIERRPVLPEKQHTQYGSTMELCSSWTPFSDIRFDATTSRLEELASFNCSQAWALSSLPVPSNGQFVIDEQQASVCDLSYTQRQWNEGSDPASSPSPQCNFLDTQLVSTLAM